MSRLSPHSGCHRSDPGQPRRGRTRLRAGARAAARCSCCTWSNSCRSSRWASADAGRADRRSDDRRAPASRSPPWRSELGLPADAASVEAGSAKGEILRYARERSMRSDRARLPRAAWPVAAAASHRRLGAARRTLRRARGAACADRDDDRHKISVQVETAYLEHQSEPREHRYVFAYTITIRNEGEVPAKLLTRHWVITDANGQVQEVRGDGVVGEQPHLQPGQGFRYSSAAVLETPVGSMQGSYQMIADDGAHFDAPDSGVPPGHARHAALSGAPLTHGALGHRRRAGLRRGARAAARADRLQGRARPALVRRRSGQPRSALAARCCGWCAASVPTLSRCSAITICTCWRWRWCDARISEERHAR